MDVTWTVAGGVLLLVALASLGMWVAARRDARRTQAEAAAARAEVARLEQRLDEVVGELRGLRQAPAPADAAAYVITDAGRELLPDVRPMLGDRLVLSAAVGEPLVRAVALGHGLRRALSPEVRHRVRFAVRQETRRARKQRRREMREVWLAHKRAGGSSGGSSGGPSGGEAASAA